jgi:hypothetical protein
MTNQQLSAARAAIVAAFCLGIATLASPRAALAQNQGSASPLHLGSFDWQGSLKNALQSTDHVLRDVRLTVSPTDRGWERIASNEHVVVVVSCAPTGQRRTRIVVIATSTNSKTAELWRNQIRARIQQLEQNLGGDTAGRSASG